jgi:transposase
VKHPLKVHVWGCFSAQGFGSIIFFTQNLNGKYMCIIYRKGLLPSATRLFPDSDNWILQEYNDPKHRSKIAMKWKQDNNVRKLPWPSMSPDLNPIENVWDILKMKIGRKKIRTLKGLKSEIKKDWNRLTPELARKLVDSVRNRLSDVIKAEGDYILY